MNNIEKLRLVTKLRKSHRRDQSRIDWDPGFWPDLIGHMADWISQNRGEVPLVLGDVLLPSVQYPYISYFMISLTNDEF
jgi:hypothetical protein